MPFLRHFSQLALDSPSHGIETGQGLDKPLFIVMECATNSLIHIAHSIQKGRFSLVLISPQVYSTALRSRFPVDVYVNVALQIADD